MQSSRPETPTKHSYQPPHASTLEIQRRRRPPNRMEIESPTTSKQLPTPRREGVNLSRQERRKEEYLREVTKSHPHRIMTGGRPLIYKESIKREEEVLLHRICLDRAPFLQKTKARHNQAESAICQHCVNEDEDSLHWLSNCPRWDTIRWNELGQYKPDPTIIQTNSDAVVRIHLAAAKQPFN